MTEIVKDLGKMLKKDLVKLIEDNQDREMQHFVALTEFLVNTVNGLKSVVIGGVDDDSEKLVVNTSGYFAVMASLEETANNFADALGMTIEAVEADEGQDAEVAVDA